MKRRQALQNIVIISSGVALLPACDFEQVPVYENIPLERKQWRMLEWLTDAILPKGELEITAPESPADFVLTMVNDCYSPADVQKYVEGLQGFEQYLKGEFGTSFKGLKEEQKMDLLTKLSESETTPENIKYLYTTTRRLAQQHFTSTEYFLKNYLDYEFVPGRYIGCVAL